MKRELSSLTALVLLVPLTAAGGAAYGIQLSRLYSVIRRSEVSVHRKIGGSPERPAHRIGVESSASSRQSPGTDDTAALRRRVNAERSRYYRPGEIDRLGFARELLSVAARSGLGVDGLRDIGPQSGRTGKGSTETGLRYQYEVRLVGGSRAFIRFLHRLESQEKSWSTDSCDLRAVGNTVNAVLAVGCREYAVPFE